MISRSLPYGLRVAVLAALYVGAAKLGYCLDAIGGVETGTPHAAWSWPPTGIALVAVLLFGTRLWPGITLGAFLVNAAAGTPLASAGGMAVGSTLEALLGAYLLRRGAFRPSLERRRDVIGLVIFAAVLSTVVGATIGVASGWLGGFIPTARCSRSWWMWWLGDMVADLVVAPLLLIWATSPRISMPPGRVAEAVVLLAATATLGLVVFGDLTTSAYVDHAYLLFPLLIWTTLRFGRRGAVTTVFVVLLIGIGGTAHGLGPFARADLSVSLFLLQSYMSVAAVTSLVLAADVTERRRVDAALRQARDELELRVQERTAELSRANAELAARTQGCEEMQERIFASRRELREYIDNMSTFNAKLDTEGRILLVNRTAQQASGFSFQELLKSNFLEGPWWSFDPDVRSRVRAAFARAVSGAPVNYDERFQLMGDREITINLSLVPVLGEDGRVAHILAEGHDITTLKEVEESLRKSQRLLAEAQQIAHVGSWEWDAVEDVITWTDELYRIYGLEPGEFDGTYAKYLARVHPEDRGIVHETVQRSYQTRQPFAMDHRLIRSDGTVGWVHGQGEVLVDETGRQVRMLGTAQDITERKAVEAELRRARDELDIRVQERTAELAKANQALQNEIAERERAAEDLARADRAKDQFLAMLAHELRNPLAAISYAVQLLQKLAPPEPPLQHAYAVIDRQVSHQARLLDDLLNVSRIARGKISLHPIRLDLVRLVRDTVEDHRRSLEAAGLSLALVIPQEPGTTTPRPCWVEGDPTRLAQVLGNLLSNAGKFTDPGGQVTVRLALVEGGKDLTTETRSGGGALWRERQRATATGAGPRGERHGEPPGETSVSSSPCPPCLRGESSVAVVTVQDTGIGIESEMLPRVFECFTQAERSLDRSRGGLGLGLALVKGLLELHGGTVRAQSEGLGRGSTFSFWLPLVPTSAASEEIVPRARKSAMSRRVLVVDDNQDAAQSLCELLSLLGHEVAVAYTGPEGVTAAREFQPEVVLCDLGLPGMDGFAVASELRQEDLGRRPRLIAISGYGQEEDRRRCREVGFEEHLTKPVDLVHLERLLGTDKVTRRRDDETTSRDRWGS